MSLVAPLTNRGFATRALVLVALLLATSTMSALALSWNSSATPLTVTGYGSTGRAYGSWGISTGTGGTVYRTSAYQKIANADNHTVYVTTTNLANSGICIQPDYTSCNQAFYTYNGSSTSHTNNASYVLKTSSAAVAPTADYHRGSIRVKLDVPWRTDPSSGATVTKGVKY